MNRREALVLVATAAAVIYGEPVAGGGATKQAQATLVPLIQLVLDGTAGIAVRYRGATVTVTPAEIMEALTGRESKQ